MIKPYLCSATDHPLTVYILQSHQLPQVLGRPPCQQVLQFKILRQSHPKSTHRDFFVTSINLVVQLLVPISVVVEGFSSPHFH